MTRASAILSSLVVLQLSCAAGVAAQHTAPYDSARPFGTLRQQAAVQQAWLKERLEVNLPKVIRDQNVDMWVVAMREYNEDPVFRALVSATTFAARRRTIYLFFDVSASKDWIQQLYVQETTKKTPEPDFYKDKFGNIVMTESFHIKNFNCKLFYFYGAPWCSLCIP